MTKRSGLVAIVWMGWALAACPVPAQERIHLHTNEAEIGEALRDGGVRIDDPAAVFAAILKNLPERVQVYPTENYFYFRFTQNGVIYVGNIRLSAADRDQGKVNFAYSERPTDWNPDPRVRDVVLGASQGVTVEKAGPQLTYRVTHAGKTITFALNDLTNARPRPESIRPDERFLGPVFDESGIAFFLMFNSRLKLFHFVLDETVPVADQLIGRKGSPIQIGKRTGFAFYEFDNRKILIGVSERESRLNTYLDGPFDQLPENVIEGEALREAILAAAPDLKGKIDRFGNFDDDSGRFLIHPYLLYRQVGDLSVFERCIASKAVAAADRAACFVIDDEESQKKNPRPLALKAKRR